MHQNQKTHEALNKPNLAQKKTTHPLNQPGDGSTRPTVITHTNKLAKPKNWLRKSSQSGEPNDQSGVVPPAEILLKASLIPLNPLLVIIDSQHVINDTTKIPVIQIITQTIIII